MPKGSAWISSKKLNEMSVHDKLTTTLNDGKVKINFSDNYQYISHGILSLVVKHVPSGLKVAFIAPTKSHKIHSKAVLSVAVANNALAVSSCEEDKLVVWDSRTSKLEIVDFTHQYALSIINLNRFLNRCLINHKPYIVQKFL